MEGNTPQAPPTQEVQPEVKDVSQTPQQPPVVPQTPPEPTIPTNPKKWLKAKVLIALMILVGLGVGGFFIWKNVFAPKEVYKGVWMPTLGSHLIPDSYLPEGLDVSLIQPIFADLDKAEQSGINTLAFQMGYWVNEQGELSMIPGEEEFFISFIDEAHVRGFKIWLNPEIIHPTDKGGPSELRIMPEELIENTDLIKNFEAGIVEIAKFAEEHDVEIFSPSSEMHVNLDFEKVGRERSKKLIVEIKPKIDAVYSGKICLRGEWPNPEFSAYSCFGPTIGIPKNEEEKNKLINKIERATKDKKIELMVGELWEGNGWQGSQEDAKRGFEMALAAVEGKVSGVFILDITRPTPLFPESFESVIKEFYTKQ